MPFTRKDLEISLGVKKCLALHVCSAVVWPPAPPGSISSCWVKVGKKVGIVSAVVTCLVKSHFSSARLIFAYCSSVCILTGSSCLGASHQPALCFHSCICTVETLSFPKISLFGFWSDMLSLMQALMCCRDAYKWCCIRVFQIWATDL